MQTSKMIHFNRKMILLMAYLSLFDRVIARTWKDYNLTVGPKTDETGRYIYESSLGGKVHCHYCEQKALRDSTYSFLQQPMCIRNYAGKKIEEAVSPQEKAESKYPLCGKGVIPGCERLPNINKTKSHMWFCDPGYSNIMFSVYFSCALVCNITDKVQYSYYCNESLQWDLERSIQWQPCEVPVIIEQEDPKPIYIGGAVAAVAALVVVLVSLEVFCYYRRKKRPRPDEDVQDRQTQNDIPQAHIRNEFEEPLIENQRPENVEVRVTPDSSIRTQTSSSGSSQTNVSVDNQPLLARVRAPTRDAGTDPDNDTQTEEEEELEGAVGPPPSNATATSLQSDTQHIENRTLVSRGNPDIKVILTKGGKAEQSIPLQNGYYSIEKGLDFAVIPNSPGGITVRDFKIERKGQGNSFRGNLFNFWFIITRAVEDDAGLFSWTMRLENNEVHEGAFEICISFPDFSTCERMEPLGQENDEEPIPSVRNHVNPQHLLQQHGNSVQHLTISSILKDPDYLINNNLVPQSQRQLTYRVSAEVHGETSPDISSLLNRVPQEAQLSSSMLRDNLHGTDSGLQTGGRNMTSPNSSRSGNLSQNRLNGIDEHDVRDRVRSGNLTVSTSGYESQRSSEIARERFNKHFNDAPGLNPESFQSEDLSDRAHLSGTTEGGFPVNHLHLSRVQESLQPTRPDPAGGASPDQDTETRRSYDPNDPEQSHRKEVVESEMPERCLYDDDRDSLSERFDNAELQENDLQSPGCEDGDGDVDSLSERLISGPIQSPEFAVLPQSLEDCEEANVDSVVVNDRILPRRETESFEIDFVRNSARSSALNSIERQHETEF